MSINKANIYAEGDLYMKAKTSARGEIIENTKPNPLVG